GAHARVVLGEDHRRARRDDAAALDAAALPFRSGARSRLEEHPAAGARQFSRDRVGGGAVAITIKTVRRPERTFATQSYLIEVWKGLLVTFRHLFVNLARHALRALGVPGEPGAVTIQFPDVPAMLGRRARTRHRLLKRDDGAPRCTACLCC